ncbi:MAG: FHA domain-containing protein [Chloroflexi bacterium]|nr:FHA domain-containing protein [Chloroflexota bacterium]
MLKPWGWATTLSISLLLILLGSIPVNAQGTAKAVLSRLDTQAFPQISAQINIHNNIGYFVHGLEPVDITIQENENTIPLDTITEVNTGAQFVFSLNIGPSYAIHNPDGISRLESVIQSVTSWGNTNSETASDDFSLITNGAIDEVHVPSTASWAGMLGDESLDPNLLIPSLDTLVRAINTASDPLSGKNLRPGILFITPHPKENELAALPSLMAQAKQRGIQINVWMVSSKAYSDSEGANQLAQLSEQTGGEFFVFSGEEALPDIENYIDPLRYSYVITYRSQITSGDNHQVAAHINTLGITSVPIQFELSILAPNPILISPPHQIVRTDQTSSHDALEQGPNYSPKEQPIHFLIEFPDGIFRPLKHTTLYVDSMLVSKNTTPPFDQFTWNLDNYTSNAKHTIKIEVEDTLGLSGTSIEHVVQFDVITTAPSMLAIIKQSGPRFIGILVIALLGAALFIMVITGRIQPTTVGRLLPENAKHKTATVQPDNQKSTTTGIKIPAWGDQLPWRKQQNSIEETAFLEFLDIQKGAADTNRIVINQRETIFGSHEDLATVIFKHPSVDATHARLRLDQDGSFYLTAKETVAGTWVNYEPMPIEGIKITHGDIIHIGGVGMCFKFSDSQKIPKPRVLPQEVL